MQTHTPGWVCQLNPARYGGGVDARAVRDLFDTDVCSVSRTTALVGDRWSLLVLRELFFGVGRFEQLRTNLRISRAVLSDRLDALVRNGLLERRRYRDDGDRARWEYALTPAGADLVPVLVGLLRWGDRYLAGDQAPVVLRHDGCGARVDAVLCCEQGHRVPVGDLVPQPGPGLASPAGEPSGP